MSGGVGLPPGVTPPGVKRTPPLSAERVRRMLTTGKRPPREYQQKAVRDFLKDNKGWVGKNWDVLNRTQYGRDVIRNAGFRVKDNMKTKAWLVHRDTGDKALWTWGRKKPYSGPPIPPKVTKDSGGRGGGGGGGAGGGGGGGAGGPQGPSQGQGEGLLGLALQRLMSLDPGAGQQPLNAAALLAGLEGDTRTQTKTIRDAMTQLEGQRDWNSRAIDKWFGQVGDSVNTARERGLKMTGDLGTALTGNNQALLESIGGSAALGASPVAQTAQQGQNTLSAMGAADAQFLNDMGPLIQAEGASLKARDLGRIAQTAREYQQQLQEITTGGNSKRAELALQIAQANNSLGQQRFQNAAGLAETMAGLGMSGIELNAKQQQALMAAMQKQQAMQEKAQAGATKTKQQQLNEWRNSLPDLPQAMEYGWAPVNGVPNQELVSYVRQKAREAGLDIRDPAVINAMIGSIQSYGGKVPPEWVKGWR